MPCVLQAELTPMQTHKHSGSAVSTCMYALLDPTFAICKAVRVHDTVLKHSARRCNYSVKTSRWRIRNGRNWLRNVILHRH